MITSCMAELHPIIIPAIKSSLAEDSNVLPQNVVPRPFTRTSLSHQKLRASFRCLQPAHRFHYAIPVDHPAARAAKVAGKQSNHAQAQMSPHYHRCPIVTPSQIATEMRIATGHLEPLQVERVQMERVRQTTREELS